MTNEPKPPSPLEPDKPALPKRKDTDRRYRVSGDPLETLKVVLANRTGNDS